MFETKETENDETVIVFKNNTKQKTRYTIFLNDVLLIPMAFSVTSHFLCSACPAHFRGSIVLPLVYFKYPFPIVTLFSKQVLMLILLWKHK